MMKYTYGIKDSAQVDLCLAAEIAALLGFHSVSQEFPVTAPGKAGEIVELLPGSILSVAEAEAGFAVTVPAGCDVAELLETLSAFLWNTGRALDTDRRIPAPADYVASEIQPDMIQPPPEDWRKKSGLERLFLVGPLFEDGDKDQLADACHFHVIIPGEPDAAMRSAVLDFAYRIGMETTSYAAPLFFTDVQSGNRIQFVSDPQCAVRMEEENGDTVVTVSGSGNDLAAMCSRICAAFPQEKPGTNLVCFLCDLIDGAAWKTADGQLAAATQHAGSVFYASQDLLNRGEALGDRMDSLKNCRELVPVKTVEFTFPWEVDVLTDLVREKLLPRVKPGDVVRILGAVSENKKVRGDLAEKLNSLLPDCRLTANILCAYKQGFSWLEEQVLPQLEGLPFENEDDGITVAFKPFLPEGVTDWGEEKGGAVPSYYVASGNPDKWLDLPIRFLQEMYPIDDILCEKLQIPRNKIRFISYDGEETYRVTVRSGGRELPEDWRYQVPVAERRYLDEFPDLGLVHPAVGYVKAWVNDEPVLDETFLTDTEQVWNAFQQEVLPEAGRFICEKCGGVPTAADQPLFGQLRLETWLSEPDEQLPCRQDLISSLDALHEDMYFAGSDYFKNIGTRGPSGQPLDAPGLLLPVIHQQEGAPVFRATLYEPRYKAPCVVKDESVSYAPWGRYDIDLTMSEIRYEAGSLCYVLDADAAQPERLAAFYKTYGELLSAGKLEANAQLLPGARFQIRVAGKTAADFTVPAFEEPKKNLDIRNVEIPDNVLMGYDEYMALIAQLHHVSGLHVYPLSRSCEGRLIYGVELASKRPGYLSRTKRISRNISEMITARHHANEVSSTNAAFMLIRELLTDEKYADLPEWLNLVIIPMLNVDGAAIHYELQREHPTWKYHVARYNALGREHGREFFNTDTIHLEAIAHRKTWWQILPDVVVDNHGVPSHEWEQQFSGYTSPSFRGFWLPRSLLYGYFWHVTEDCYRCNLQLDHRMEEVIADVVNADPEIARWNTEWIDRFETYAHSWMPGLFPADYYRNMINYWVPYPYTPGHTYDSVRYPWITTVYYTSEVADETAQGEYLALCAHTHLIHDLATLDLLRQGRSVYRHETVRQDNHVFFSLTRKRPALCLQADER